MWVNEDWVDSLNNRSESCGKLKGSLMSGMIMCVGGWEAVEDGVTRQFAGRKAACVVMLNRAAKATLMSGK